MRASLAALAFAACSSPQQLPAVTPVPLTAPVARAVEAAAPAAAIAPPTTTAPAKPAEPAEPAKPAPRFTRIRGGLFPDDTASVTIEDTVWVKAQPFADASRLGLIGSGTRVEYLSHVENADCETPWIEVAPRGFVCAAAEASDQPPTEPRHRRRAMIGRYAIAARGAKLYRSVAAALSETGGRPARGDMIRRRSRIELDDGRVLWRTDRNEYIDASQVRRLWGSRFHGVRLDVEGAPELPIAFAVDRRRPRRRIALRRAPDRHAAVVRHLEARQVVSVRARSEDGAFVEIAPGGWVARDELRIVEATATPPPGAGDQVWVDVDLDEQLVVLYRGRRPIFATLASTGRRGHETPTGTFRVTRKKIRTTMRSDRSKRQTYSVAVPWSTYFHEGYALHSAYWHDGFGKPHSHGCVNLSPGDALTVFQLLGPTLRPGWSVAYGSDAQPGSLVRVHSSENPTGANPEDLTESVIARLAWMP